jgi:anion-transporting  ArsA/GET3 family ATPase
MLDRRLLCFTGKGGVGKSTMAAATALLAAQRAKRVLLVEVDAKGALPALLGHEPVGYHPEVATAAPGVKEILTIGKILGEVRAAIDGTAEHDLVIVDAAATGHVVAQLGAPQSIRELADVGPLRSQTEWMIDLLSDPAITQLNVVTTPEEMPVAETIELVARVRAELSVPLGSVIVNRVLPELFTHADEAAFEAMRAPGSPAAEWLSTRAGVGTAAVLDGARLAVELRRARAEHLDALRAAVDLPLLYVPYQFTATPGLRMTTLIAEALGEELGL